VADALEVKVLGCLEDLLHAEGTQRVREVFVVGKILHQTGSTHSGKHTHGRGKNKFITNKHQGSSQKKSKAGHPQFIIGLFPSTFQPPSHVLPSNLMPSSLQFPGSFPPNSLPLSLQPTAFFPSISLLLPSKLLPPSLQPTAFFPSISRPLPSNLPSPSLQPPLPSPSLPPLSSLLEDKNEVLVGKVAVRDLYNVGVV